MKQIAVLVTLLALSACSLPVFFRVPVAQGNIVTPEQVAKLKKGMNKKQVEYVLGTPLIKPAFEKNRWDYVFYYRNPRAHVRHSKLNLYFTHGQLSDIEGSEEYATQIASIDGQSGMDADAPANNQIQPAGESLSSVEQRRAPSRETRSRGLDGRRQPSRSQPPASNQTRNNPAPPGGDGQLPNAGAPLPGNPATQQP